MGDCGEGRLLAEAAASLIGCPFRLLGRNPATGLDCVGLVAACLAALGRFPKVPQGYGLRNSSIEQWVGFADLSGLNAATGDFLPGDILLTALGRGQHHLMIVEKQEVVIHAHAGLRRVVRQPFQGTENIVAHWRLTPDNRGDSPWRP